MDRFRDRGRLRGVNRANFIDNLFYLFQRQTYQEIISWQVVVVNRERVFDRDGVGVVFVFIDLRGAFWGLWVCRTVKSRLSGCFVRF